MHVGRCAGVEKTAVLSFLFFCHADVTMSSLQKGSRRHSRDWEEQSVLMVCIWATRNWFLIEDFPSSRSSASLCYCLVVVSDFATPGTAARQAPLPLAISQSLPKFMSIELVMPSNHLLLCRPLLLPSIFPSSRVFSKESAVLIRWPQY